MNNVDEVRAYLGRVRQHFGLTGQGRFTLFELVAMLDEYDKIEPASPSVLAAVVDVVVLASKKASAKFN